MSGGYFTNSSLTASPNFLLNSGGQLCCSVCKNLGPSHHKDEFTRLLMLTPLDGRSARLSLPGQCFQEQWLVNCLISSILVIHTACTSVYYLTTIELS